MAATNNTISPVHFLSGISLSFGKSEQVVLTIGAAASKVKSFDNAYNLVDPFDLKGAPTPTHDEFLISWFAGLSYSLSSWNVK